MAATQMKRIDMESIRSWLLGYVALLSSATASYSLRLAIASSMSQPARLEGSVLDEAKTSAADAEFNQIG